MNNTERTTVNIEGDHNNSSCATPVSIDLHKDDDNNNNNNNNNNVIHDSGSSNNTEYEYEEQEENIVKYRRGKQYVNPRIYDHIIPTKLDTVPDDIDGICMYEVPMMDKGSLRNCKGSRPWGKASTSNSTEFTAGPRLLLPCRGSNMCQNKDCPNVMEFGTNRVDFTERNDEIVCSICAVEAKYVPCNARMFIEKDNKRKKCTVKHHGTHTCIVTKRGRPDVKEIEDILDVTPDITREAIIRQGVKRKLQEDGIEAAFEHAKKLTDTKFIDNVVAKKRKLLNPNGHSFEAIKIIKNSWDGKDKFLIYKVDDGSERGFPYVIKSSRRKVELMLNMDHEGDHSLKESVVFLDVVHSRTKGFKTYTLSYYDVALRSLIILCTMDTASECYATCKFFFHSINDMINELIDEEDRQSTHNRRFFNPYHLKDDEAGGNKLAMKEVYGEEFVLKRTSSCEYHFNENTKRHAKYVKEEDQHEYFELTKDSKESSTEKEYEKCKRLLEILISRQGDPNSTKLTSALEWWHERRSRWALAYQTTTHNIPLSSLAEAGIKIIQTAHTVAIFQLSLSLKKF